MAPLLRKSTYQVIHDLPDSATEWQKDSAVQAYFQPGQNIRYSDRPDTLGLPGQRYEAPPGTLCADSLGYPKAYLDSFAWSRQGKAHAAKAADPVPYRTGADNLVASMLVVGSSQRMSGRRLCLTPQQNCEARVGSCSSPHCCWR